MSPTPVRVNDVSDRWTPVWHVFFYVMIVVATALLVATGGAEARVRAVGLVTLLSVWHGLMMVRPGRGHRERPAQVGIYLAGAILLSFLLVSLHPVFLMVGMSLYNQVFAFMVLRWALPAAALLTVSNTLAVTRSRDPGTAVVVIVGAGAALLFSLYLAASAEESRKRRELIEELERTRERLAFAERLAGQTEERYRIGRDLHDTVTQQLVGIVMHLEATGANAEAPDRMRDAFERCLALAREGLAEARRLVWAERPSQLDAGPLTRAVASAAEHLARDAGIAVDTSLDEALDTLPVDLQTLVLRALQEGLANVRKHAHARHVTVTAAVSGELLTLDVHDDGVGFDEQTGAAPKDKGGGFGLHGLRERVGAVGGELTIESARGLGTTLAVHVRLNAEKKP